jgi:hypothetical protein
VRPPMGGVADMSHVDGRGVERPPAWAFGFVSVRVCESTAYLARRRASRPVARPPQSSVILRGRIRDRICRELPMTTRRM